jgi:Leucine-rich repeat (LRR) protein
MAPAGKPSLFSRVQLEHIDGIRIQDREAKNMSAIARAQVRAVASRIARLAIVVALGFFLVARPACAEPQDRQVAEWVLLLGGSVRIEGSSERVRELTALPSGDFHLELVDLVGANILPPDLKWLTGLTRLRILNLPGPMWNPSSGAEIDYSRNLRHIAGIPSLQELTFSSTYLDSIKFVDSGIEEIAGLAPSLRVLSLENTQVRGRHLGKFKNLEALDLVYCPVSDEGLKQIGGLTKLRKLLLRDALISDEGLASLKDLTNLEQLDLGGTRISDAGAIHLAGMTRLKKLSLQSAGITDEGLRKLADLKQLEELNLYGTKVSNASVDVFLGMQHLRMIDLRYSRMSRAGVDRLVAAVPRCNVTFLDSSVRPAVPAGAERVVAGQGDAAVAEWVRAMGGKAVVNEGQLLVVTLAATSVTDELLRNLQGLAHLRTLDLGSTEIGDPGAAHLAGLASLVELDLSRTLVSDAALAQLAGLTKLRKLNLSDTQISGAGLAHLTMLPLEELRLSNSPVGDQGVANLGKIASLKELALAFTDVTNDGLAELASLGDLKRLDLAGTDVGDKGLAHVAKLAGLTGLSLDYTRITDSGMPQLEKLTGLTQLGLTRTRLTDKSMKTVGQLSQLADLNLDYTDVGDEGLAALAGLAKLGRLSLDSTNVTDASAERIAQFKQLRQLNLYHTFYSEKGKEQIRAALPQCEMIFDARSSDPKRRRS